MSDEDEPKLLHQYDMDHNRRRLSVIKSELQGLMRQKKKYDEEKLKQDADFLQSEINDLRNSIFDINKEINNQTQTKKKLHVQMTNLRSRSRLRYTNLAIALRDKRRYEVELKKENKTEEYRDLARGEIRSIDAALPILKEEDEYKARLKSAEDAQQAATVKRKKLEENLNKNLRKQTEIKQLLGENAEKLPTIETKIESLRNEREQLVSSNNTSSSTNGKKSRRRLLSNQSKQLDSPSTDAQTPVQSHMSLEEDCLEYEKHQYETQLDKVNTLLNYFREKLNEHGLNNINNQTCLTPSSELTSPLYHPITPSEEQSILSSYMEEHNSDNISINEPPPPTTIAMKLPRNFTPLNLNASTTNEIIHSPYYDGHEIEYKKELSSDILNKYGGQQKKLQQQFSVVGKKHKKNKKNFAITHNPQMIVLYNHIRNSTGSSDTLPSMPMYEYDLFPTIQSLEFFKQSLESYLNELSHYHRQISYDNEQQSQSEIDDDDIRDSALDTYSETSSLVESIKEPISHITNILEERLSTSSDDKKTLTSSSSNKDDHEDLNAHLIPLHISNNQIDRQISDEGYRSVRHDQQQQVIDRSNNYNSSSSSSLIRSDSFNCTDKVDQWLLSTTPISSAPILITADNDFQPTDNNDEGENLHKATTISVLND
ncbi:unnamed protein product [Adineta steineri]|uniref:Uncharacterized protein n=2 Tax=Adineta steineri TaxID=433720 RepID=A0A814VB63_9BILA|nr:unnamed protein product [Adineta steineri]CAF1553231.1 unnamed protein product [Adineta steineri]